MKKIRSLILMSVLFILTLPVTAGSFKIDAAFYMNDKQICLFSGKNYYLVHSKNRTLQSKGIISSQSFPGVTFKTIDAAINCGNGKAYFFSGEEYIRFDMTRFRADPDYPKPINNTTWPGLPFKSIDAAVNWRNGKAYFFKGNSYTRYDIADDKNDSNYPKTINSSTWPELSFSEIDAGVSFDDEQVYFFAGGRYNIYSVDEHEKKIGNFSADWKGFTGDRPVDPHNDVSGIKVNSYKLNISPYKVKSPTSVLGKVQAAVWQNGSFMLGIQQEDDVILLRYNNKFQRTVAPLTLKNYRLSEMLALPDGSLVVMAGRDENNTYLSGYPNTLYAIKLSRENRQIFKTYIFGGKGHGPGKSWFDGRSSAKISSNGNSFGVYLEVQKNWAEAGAEQDIHNGDMFVELDKNGKIIEGRTHFWTASHSSTIQVCAYPTGEYYTMTIGDAYPYGLQVYNRNKDKNFVIWPPKEDYIPYEKVKSTNAAGILEDIAVDGKDLIAFMGTLEHPNLGVFSKVDPLFLKFDIHGNILKKKWLTVTPDKDESVISVAPMGKNYLVGWGKGNDYDDKWKPGPLTISLIDGNGNFIRKPKELNYPFGTYSRFYKTSSNSLIWLLSDNNSQYVTVHRLEVK